MKQLQLLFAQDQIQISGYNINKKKWKKVRTESLEMLQILSRQSTDFKEEQPISNLGSDVYQLLDVR